MDASQASTGPDAGLSGKPSGVAARRSSRIKGAEKASDSGADATPQPKIPSKPRPTRVVKKPKVRMLTKPNRPEVGTNISELDSSPTKEYRKSTLEQAKTIESTRVAEETASTPGDQSSPTLSASTIKPDDGSSVSNLPPNRAAPSTRAVTFGNQPNTPGGPHMALTYSSLYGHDQLAKHPSATHRHPIYPEVPMGAQTSSQRSSLLPAQKQPPNILASHTRGTTTFSPAKGHTPSVAEYVAAKRLAPAMTDEGNRIMTSPYEFVSLSNVQLARDPLSPYSQLPPPSHILPSQLPKQSRSTATPGTSVPHAFGRSGDVSGVIHKAAFPGTITNTGRTFHTQRPSDHNNLAGQPAFNDSSIFLPRQSGCDNREETFKPSVAQIAAIPGQDLQIQNGLPLDNLASHPAPTDSGVGLTTACGVPAVIVQLCLSYYCNKALLSVMQRY